MAGYEDMIWRNIRRIRNENDERFVRWVLEARSDYLRLRLRQEPALRQIYVGAADSVAGQLRDFKGDTLMRNHLRAVEKSLRHEADLIAQRTSEKLKADLTGAATAGSKAVNRYLVEQLQQAGVNLDYARLQWGFGQVNTAAVEAIWSRTRNGMLLSDRIWQAANDAHDVIRDIVRDGVARGRDAVSVARDLEQYVRHGARTFAEDYPNMMARMGRRIPNDICYEALRLARTEMSMAFMEGTYAAGRANPAYKGVCWYLSSSHPVPDVCDDLASADLYGLGPGCYPAGDEPALPHPNCLCVAVPLAMDSDELVERLREWLDDPASQPGLEEWYNEVYRGASGYPLHVVSSPPTAPPAPSVVPTLPPLGRIW